jgi:hypothetical protein
MTSAYNDGENARVMGNLPKTANPYSPENDKYEEWNYGWEDSDKEIEDKKTESSEAIKDIQYLMKRPDVQEVWKNIIVQETLMGMPTGTGEYYPSIFNAAANKIADSIIQSFINTKVE